MSRTERPARLIPAAHSSVKRFAGMLCEQDASVWPSVWPLMIFLFVVGSVALARYRCSLD